MVHSVLWAAGVSCSCSIPSQLLPKQKRPSLCLNTSQQWQNHLSITSTISSTNPKHSTVPASYYDKNYFCPNQNQHRWKQIVVRKYSRPLYFKLWIKTINLLAKMIMGFNYTRRNRSDRIFCAMEKRKKKTPVF